jgi:protein-S-isoprenylcysteine O-methyltransferase Ste14
LCLEAQSKFRRAVSIVPETYNISLWYSIAAMKNKSLLLVALQLIFIFLFLMSGPVFANNVVLLMVEFFAIVFSCWAVILMTLKSKISPYPEPKEQARLLDTGPYRYVRNPMYSGVLLAMVALLLDNFSPMRLILWILLATVFLSKISIEEKLLTEKFKDYASYKSRTKRLIPFLY